MTTRRSFLKRSLLSAAAISLPARVYAAAPGANSDIRVGVIGFNGRGRDHIGNYLSLAGSSGVRIAGLCDVDSRVLASGVEQISKKGHEATAYTDIRKMLENKDLDVISIATPNHWHSLGAIWALQAGKDVYVEKPVSHNVWEGRQLVKWAQAGKQIIQMGARAARSTRKSPAYSR